MALGGGFGLRNTLILFGGFNIFVIVLAALINNFFPTVPFATIISAYTNLFLTSVTLFLAGTVGFAEIVFNVGFQALWALLNFGWEIIITGSTGAAIPVFLETAPSFNFTPLTNTFVGLFQAIIAQPLFFAPPLGETANVIIGGTTTGVIANNFVIGRGLNGEMP